MDCRRSKGLSVLAFLPRVFFDLFHFIEFVAGRPLACLSPHLTTHAGMVHLLLTTLTLLTCLPP